MCLVDAKEGIKSIEVSDLGRSQLGCKLGHLTLGNLSLRNRSRRTALTEQLAGIACLHLAPLRGAAAQQIVHNLPIEDLRRTIAHDFQHNQCKQLAA